MSGLFGFLNFEKEGPGISKNAPKKKTFFIFFETFFRNFWKLFFVNIFYWIVSLPILTNGLATAGITNVTRNIARDKHSFGVSDYFETIKKNWKQALPAGIINLLVYAILIFDLYFFYNITKGVLFTIGMGITLSFLIIFTVMNYFIWTMIITFNLPLKQIYKNSFKFVFINLKGNLICIISILLVYAINVALLFLIQRYFFHVLIIELLIYVLFFPSFRGLIIQYSTFPAIKKYIIDPYYAEHPDADIEKRRNLGIEIEQAKTSDDDNNNQEDSENVFED